MVCIYVCAFVRLSFIAYERSTGWNQRSLRRLQNQRQPLARRPYSRATPQRSARSYRTSSTVKADILTIAPRSRINRHDDRDRCSASSQRVMHSAFFPFTAGSITPSSFAAITSVLTNIVQLAMPPFAHGATSAKLRPQHNLQSRLFGH